MLSQVRNNIRNIFLKLKIDAFYILSFSSFLINIFICYGKDHWEEEETDVYCETGRFLSGLSGQIECQAKCKAISTCPGISYSYHSSIISYCYVCIDDILSPADSNYGFHRKVTSLLVPCTLLVPEIILVNS